MKSFLKIPVLAAFIFISVPMYAVVPSNSSGSSTTNTTDNILVGAGVTMADGTFILLALGMAFAGRKWYEAHRKKTENPV